MAGENREQNIDQKAREDDALFMQIIRDFPTIYNRASKDFKDTNKKANCWRTIAQRLGEPVDSVKRRYETIRTDFSRYLRKKKGKSGSVPAQNCFLLHHSTTVADNPGLSPIIGDYPGPSES